MQTPQGLGGLAVVGGRLPDGLHERGEQTLLDCLTGGSRDIRHLGNIGGVVDVVVLGQLLCPELRQAKFRERLNALGLGQVRGSAMVEPIFHVFGHIIQSKLCWSGESDISTYLIDA